MIMILFCCAICWKLCFYSSFTNSLNNLFTSTLHSDFLSPLIIITKLKTQWISIIQYLSFCLYSYIMLIYDLQNWVLPALQYKSTIKSIWTWIFSCIAVWIQIQLILDSSFECENLITYHHAGQNNHKWFSCCILGDDHEFWHWAYSSW